MKTPYTTSRGCPTGSNLRKMPGFEKIVLAKKLNTRAFEIYLRRFNPNAIPRVKGFGSRKDRRKEARLQLAQEMLTSPTSSIKKSLWKVPLKQKKNAQLLLKKLQELSQMSNAPNNIPCRKTLLSRIAGLSEKFDLREECYLQLIRLTGNEPGGEHYVGTWQMFAEVAEALKCPEEVKELVIQYANYVASSTETGFVRQMAWSVRKRLQASPGVREVQIGLCSGVESTRVELADGTMRLIYYDSMTTIAELLYLSAWVFGFEHTDLFQLYKMENGREEMLSRDERVESALRMSNNRLFLKKEMTRLKEDGYYSDQLFFDQAFVQAKKMYLKGDFVVTDDDAAYLAALLIFADHGSCLSSSPDYIRNSYIQRSLPEGELRSNYNRFIGRVNNSLTELVIKERKEAKRLFLSKLDEHPMGNCLMFWAHRVESSCRGLQGESEIGINRHRIYFFTDKIGDEGSMFFSMDSVIDCKCDDEKVDLKIKADREIANVLIYSNDGLLICRTIECHSRDLLERRDDATDS